MGFKMFEIEQIIEDTCIDGEYADIDHIHIGYVRDEFFAQEFCQLHPDCRYGSVPVNKYVKELEANMVTSNCDLELISVPVKKYEE